MTLVVFWDVDTQHDFMDPDGALYVPGAEAIVPNLERLTRCARHHGLQIVATVDDHAATDRELSAEPNFRETFPPHCLRGTRGQQKIEATRPQRPLYIDNRQYTRAELDALLRDHRGEIVIRKQEFNVFSNPATAEVVALIDPRTVVVYGVAQDVCVHHAIMGLSDRQRHVRYVRDASQPLNADAAKRCEAEWLLRGVEFVSTADVVKAVESGKLRA